MIFKKSEKHDFFLFVLNKNEKNLIQKIISREEFFQERTKIIITKF